MSIKLYCFMVNPHELLILQPDGTQLNRIEVDSEAEAKELLQGEVLNQALAEKIGTTGFSTLWVDDPAGDAEVMGACRLMEEKQAAARSQISGPNNSGVVCVHTQGRKFFIKTVGEFHEVDVVALAIDDTVKYTETIEGEENPFESPEYTVVATAINTGEEGSGDYIVQLKLAPEVGSEPQFAPPSHGKKVIEVECEVSASEAELRRLIRDMQLLEIEANHSAAEYREQIKAAKKRIYDLSNGKAYTSKECDVVNNWESGERQYIDPDTGLVVKTEEISMEERQLNMLPELEAATETEPEAMEVNSENSDSGEPGLDAPVDESGNPAAENDMPPPPEDSAES